MFGLPNQYTCESQVMSTKNQKKPKLRQRIRSKGVALKYPSSNLISSTCKSSMSKISVTAISSMPSLSIEPEETLATSHLKSKPNVKERLMAAEGGYYLSDEAAELLGITEQQIAELHQANKIIGLPVQDGRYVYPKWQFAKQEKSYYQPLQGLDEVLAKFPETDPWMQAAFMLNSSGCSEIGTPLSGLQAGKVAEVLLLAQRFGEHGAA
jgi:hypothetical protein